jgi:dynein heavy chain
LTLSLSLSLLRWQTRLTFLLDLLLPLGAPVMLVGNAGTAKTTVLADKLRSLPDNMLSYTINFNSFSDSASLQPILEQPLEKKTGATYGPPGTKKLVYCARAPPTPLAWLSHVS